MWRRGFHDAEQPAFGPLLDGADHERAFILGLPERARAQLRDARRVTCRVEGRARNGMLQDAHPWVACDVATPVEPQRNLDGVFATTWTWERESLEALRQAIPDAVRVVVGVHGAGDYTTPDTVALTAVTLTIQTTDERD